MLGRDNRWTGDEARAEGGLHVHKITPFLWFNDGADEAAKLYVSIFAGSVVDEQRWGPGGAAPEGSLLSVTFEIDGREFIAFNGGPDHPFTDAFSISVTVDTQEELDSAWDRLIEDGGRPVACGWLQDRFGLSWQIVPNILMDLLRSSDGDAAARVTAVMLNSVKLDFAEIKAAAAG
jgi:predicted 3-demethylubiquinone-9 3-methyltransferase (glyoxalase superfamily)